MLTLCKYFIYVFIFLLDTISDWNSFKSVKHLFLSIIVQWPMLICSPAGTIPTIDDSDENEDDVLCCSLSLIVAFSWMLLLNRSVSFFWPPEVVKIFLSDLYVVEDLLWLQPVVFCLLIVEWKFICTATCYLYLRVY